LGENLDETIPARSLRNKDLVNPTLAKERKGGAASGEGWASPRNELLHRDRDFDAFEKVLGLRVVKA